MAQLELAPLPQGRAQSMPTSLLTSAKDNRSSEMIPSSRQPACEAVDVVIDSSATGWPFAECVGELRQSKSQTELAVKSAIGLPSEVVDGLASSEHRRREVAAEVEEATPRSSRRRLVSSISPLIRPSVVKA